MSYTPTYTFLYTDVTGATSPITLEEWAANNLTPAEVIACQAAVARQVEFKANLANFATVYDYPFTSGVQTQIDMSMLSGIPDNVLYRFYNVADYIIEFNIPKVCSAYSLDITQINADLLEKYKHTRKALLFKQFCVAWLDSTNPMPQVHRLLRYNGLNAVEQNLAKFYEGAFDGTNAPVFPDADWEKYQEMFLADPKVSISPTA